MMRGPAQSILKITGGLLLTLSISTAVHAQSQTPPDTKQPKQTSHPVPQPTTRIHGIIDRETTWRGRIILTDDTAIIGATVHVEPGTLIEFANADNPPVLSIGNAKGERGNLILAATANEPITIASREGTEPGRIEFHLWDEQEKYNPQTEGVSLEINHVHFKRLGDSGSPQPRYHRPPLTPPGNPDKAKPGAPRAARIPPSLAIVDHGIGAAIHVSDCRFERTTAIQISCGSAARFIFENNTVYDCLESAAIAVRTAESEKWNGRATITANRLECPIDMQCPWFDISENVIVGRRAAIVTRKDAIRIAMIIHNYVHNTAAVDGGYCLDAQSTAVQVSENILIGGAETVYRGSRSMTGNFIISAESIDGAASDQADDNKSPRNVSALPEGARFEGNTLIGFGSLLMRASPDRQLPGERTPKLTTIRNNRFIGTGDAQIAIEPPFLYGGCGNDSPRGLIAERNQFFGLSRYNYRRTVRTDVRESNNTGGESPSPEDPVNQSEVERNRARKLIASLLSQDHMAAIRNWEADLFEKSRSPESLLRELTTSLSRAQSAIDP